jgi:hypothetical protein
VASPVGSSSLGEVAFPSEFAGGKIKDIFAKSTSNPARKSPLLDAFKTIKVTLP